MFLGLTPWLWALNRGCRRDGNSLCQPGLLVWVSLVCVCEWETRLPRLVLTGSWAGGVNLARLSPSPADGVPNWQVRARRERRIPWCRESRAWNGLTKP